MAGRSSDITTAKLDDIVVSVPDLEHLGAGPWTLSPTTGPASRQITTIGTGSGRTNLPGVPMVAVQRFRYLDGTLLPASQAPRQVIRAGSSSDEPLGACSLPVWVSASQSFGLGLAIVLPSDHGDTTFSVVAVPQGKALEPLLDALVQILLAATDPQEEPLLECASTAAFVSEILNTKVDGIKIQHYDFALPPTVSWPERDAVLDLSFDEVKQRARAIEVAIPLSESDYGDGQNLTVPRNLPLIDDFDRWVAVVDLTSGQISDWPTGYQINFSLKVREQGTYTLLDEQGTPLARIDNYYVPNGLVPGRWGDYVDLDIDENGTVTNWPTSLSFDDFAVIDE